MPATITPSIHSSSASDAAISFADSGVAPTVRRLANGLTIVAEQMPTDAVTLSLWINVGSSVEANSINGMAHFLEHMVFKGTPNIRCGEFERLIEERGAITNAVTSQDYTHYYLTCAPKDFSELAPLQVELVLNSSLSEADMNRERPVILEEIRRSEDNSRRRMFARSMEMSFDRLPYRRPVLGPAEVIETLSAEQMQAFHQTWYRPCNMTAVAVGNLDVERLIETVETSFSQALSRRLSTGPALGDLDLGDPADDSIPKAFEQLLGISPLSTPEVPFTQIQRADYCDTTLQQARLIMGWRVPGMIQIEETYALDVIASILGHGRTARLIHDLRETQKLVTSLSVVNMTYGQQGVFYISAQLPVDNLVQVEQAIVSHIQQLHTDLVTDAELARIRTQVANRYVFGCETPSDRAGLYGYYQAITGDLSHALRYPHFIRAVSAADVQRAVQQYLPVDAYGVVSIRDVDS
jgi:zinc protease